MQKNEFLKALRWALRDLPRTQRDRYLADYAELIEDKREAGMSEEAAIAELGSVDELARPILADAREQGLLKPRRSPLTIVLLALGSPIWLSLAVAGLSVILALYVCAWACIVTLGALELTLGVMLPAAIVYFFTNAAANMPFCLFVLGASCACAACAAALYRPIARLISGLARGSLHVVKKIWKGMRTKGSALL